MESKAASVDEVKPQKTVSITSPAYILDDHPAEEDALDFKPYVAALADIIMSHTLRKPLTIGVFGAWGSGKTSLMDMIRKRLSSGFHDVWFDAWRYEREESLWRALLLHVLAALRDAVLAEKSDETEKALDELDDLQTALYRTVDREEAGRVRIDWSKLAAGVGQGAVQVGLSFIPGGSMLADLVKSLKGKAGEAAAQDLVKAIHRERSKIHIEQVRFLEDFHKKFQNLVRKYVLEEGRRLVVFVDDLDRCLPDKAVEVLEAIKLFLDAPGCVFVLGLDQEVIAQGIEIKYREFAASGVNSQQDERRFLIEGSRYLEKIIQLPFHIPPIERGNVAAFVNGLVDEWPHKECPGVFAEGVGDNPRQVKRTVNVFLLLWRLAQKRSIALVKPVRLSKIVAVQHVYPQLYEVLRETPRLLRDLEDYYRKEALSPLEGEDRGEGGRLEPPPALAPYVHSNAVRRLMTLHSSDMPEMNFTGLAPDELRLYFTLTRRAESPPLRKMEGPREGLEPQMVRVPEGPFLMGSIDEDPSAEEVEKPQHTVKLAEFLIGKYPITNVEYQVFVRENRYDPPRGWDGDKYPEEKGDHPVVNVSWGDATAYCAWLSEKTKKDYRLPSEAEWEKVARGEEGRIYPWGNEWDKTKANSEEADVGETTSVGQYSPHGDSPSGAADMAGNVWEWTRSMWGKDFEKPEFKYPYDPKDGREYLDAGGEVLRVLRGGAFRGDARYLRCACRYRYGPDRWRRDVGFRVVLSPL